MSGIIQKISYAAFIAMLLTPSLSFARGACKADREKFCANVQRGEGRIRNCMKEHYNQLSTECKQKIEERRAEHQSQQK